MIASPEGTTLLGIRRLSGAELPEQLPSLVRLLRDTVNGGSPLGFLPPLTEEAAGGYWLSLRPELYSGVRLLLTANTARGVIGSVQLALATMPNGRHRAEVQKLFVAPIARGQGIGRALMSRLHEVARERGRTLLLLNTRSRGPAERFYKALGYGDAGVVPGWSVGSSGERYDHVRLYRELLD
jgi:GNAT superfamily N-acetyltransferase